MSKEKEMTSRKRQRREDPRGLEVSPGLLIVLIISNLRSVPRREVPCNGRLDRRTAQETA